MKKNAFFIGIISLLSLFLTSCVSIKNLQQSQIDGRKVEYATGGAGSPTVVFETGMGPDIKTWGTVIDSISGLTSTFVYNRQGYGNSNIHNPPLSITELAQQLHKNLEATGQSPPYILVGHSLGGLSVNMYARLYPEEVAGVVFLDASHPDQFEYFRVHQTLLYNILITSTTKGSRKYEHDIVVNTQSDFQNAPPFPNVPIVVLTAGKKSSPLESDQMRKKWLAFQKDIASLSENSKHIIVEGSGHYIHKDKPHAFVDEMIKMINLQIP